MQRLPPTAYCLTLMSTANHVNDAKEEKAGDCRPQALRTGNGQLTIVLPPPMARIPRMGPEKGGTEAAGRTDYRLQTTDNWSFSADHVIASPARQSSIINYQSKGY